MSTTQRTIDLGHAKARLSPASLFGFAARAAASLWRVLHNRRDISRLNDLEDAQLMDMGLTRADLDAALSTSRFFEDPSGHLTQSARRRMRSNFRL